MKLIAFLIPWCGVLVGTASPSLYFHPTPVTLTPPPERLRDNAFFGYSVAYEPVSKKFIVGAPNADRIGKVYECDTTNRICKYSTPKIKFNNATKETNGYWLGATIAAGKSFYVVCAPRTSDGIVSWIIEGHTAVHGTAGKCYVSKTSTSDHIWEDLPTMNTRDRDIVINKPKDALQDSLAWSMSIFNNSVLMGGPAIMSGKAALYTDLKAKPKVKCGIKQKFENSFINFGYSVYITDSNRTIKYFVSSTFGERGIGKVYGYNKNFEVQYIKNDMNIVGVLYGASMCTIEIPNGDNLLLVGSPAYRDPDTNTYDVGVVHVYALPNGKKSKIEGSKNGGYFGNTMAKLDDLNGDSISDLAVSAPYEDDRRGAVYIYSGATMLEPQPRLLQRIQPAAGARYFGLSLTTMPNLDNNGCSGLGIGAPGSGIALVLHCIPSVIVNISIKFPDLQRRYHLKSAEANETYFKFTWCLEISSKRPKLMKLEFSVVVKVDHQNAKLLDMKSRPQDDANIYYVVLNDRKLCENSTVYLPKKGFYENPLHITVTADQVPQDKEEYDPGRMMVSDLSSLNVSEQVWAAECRNGAHCEPSLHADAYITVDNNYVIGSTEEEALKIAVNNSGETAYNLCVSVRVSGALVKVAPECEQDGAQGGWRCPAPGPLRRDAQWKLKDIILDMASLDSTAKEVSYKVKVLIHCTSVKVKITNTVSVQKDVQGIVIKGIDNFEGRLVVKDNLKQRLNHKYTITNNGITIWRNLKFVLTIPWETYSKNYSSEDLSIRSGKSEMSSNCYVKDMINLTEVACEIKKLQKGEIISIFFTSTIVTKEMKNGNFSFGTTLVLDLDGVIKTETVHTVIQVEKLAVPVWIIVTSVVIGALLLVLMTIIMQESGILKRKNKEKLNRLHTSLRRQTLRQSMTEAFQATNDDMKDQLVVEDDFVFEEEGICEIIDMKNQEKH